VLPRTYDNQVCSVARTLEVIGDRWTMLVIRDAFHGVRRFEEFQERLGIARNVLSARLMRLVEEGVFEKHRYRDRPPRFEYRLTPKGVDLFPVMISLMKWGDRHVAAPDGPPVAVLHRGCGGEVDERLLCDRCGEPVTALTAEARATPARSSPGARPPRSRAGAARARSQS
jgi:DNA-binding HxlR family transcriptional regulator